MTSAEFTKNICLLILQMVSEGESPILYETGRSREQQRIYFLAGKSKLDGEKKCSDHQMHRAGDIGFDSNRDGKLDAPVKGWRYWHSIWEALGGDPPVAEWDMNHFSGKGK